MSDISAGHPTEPGRYEIRLKGHLASRWTTWFTVMQGPVVDQAALHGLLHKVRDIGLPLLSVTQIDADEPTRSPPNPDNSYQGD